MGIRGGVRMMLKIQIHNCDTHVTDCKRHIYTSDTDT